MPDPYDYTSAFAGLQAPGDSFLSGIKNGIGISELQIKRDQDQVAFARKQQMQAELASLGPNASPQQIGAMIVKYPEISEQLKRANDVTAPAQQQSRLDGASQVYAALQANSPGVAKKLLTDQAAAARNSGMEQDAKAADTMAQLITNHPELARTTIGLRLAAAVGPDKFADTFGKLGSEDRAGQLQPDLVRKGAADADSAVSGADSAKSKATTDAVTAKYADAKALLDLEGIRTDNQFKRDQTKIGYLNAQIGRENNQIKRQELSLQLQKAQQEFGDKARAKVADAESAAGSIDNMLNNIDRILSVAEEKKDGKGTGRGTSLLRAASGPLDSRLPTMQSDVADLEALVETLGSQAFLSQIPNIKGMGSLSNAEGEKLQSAFQNFSLKQSDGQIISNLKEAQRLLKQGRGTISKRFGVQLGNPNTPAAADSRPPLSSFGG